MAAAQAHATDSVEGHWQQPPHLSNEQHSNLENSWNFADRPEDTFGNLQDVSLGDFSGQDADFAPWIQNLQSTFGGTVVPGTMWQALDNSYTTGSFY